MFGVKQSESLLTQLDERREIGLKYSKKPSNVKLAN